MIKDGTHFQAKQFERNTVNPCNMRNVALRELSAKPRGEKARARRLLRIALPAWLGGASAQSHKKMEDEMK